MALKSNQSWKSKYLQIVNYFNDFSQFSHQNQPTDLKNFTNKDAFQINSELHTPLDFEKIDLELALKRAFYVNQIQQLIGKQLEKNINFAFMSRGIQRPMTRLAFLKILFHEQLLTDNAKKQQFESVLIEILSFSKEEFDSMLEYTNGILMGGKWSESLNLLLVICAVKRFRWKEKQVREEWAMGSMVGLVRSSLRELYVCLPNYEKAQSKFQLLETLQKEI